MGVEHTELIRAFAEQTWPERNRSRAFYRWRYAECPALAGYLAIRDGQCVAMVTALERPYQIGGQSVDVRESFDWFTLPRFKGGGAGVRVLQRMMKDEQPITVIGGTSDTRDLLPRLGFRVLGELQSYSLPLGSRRASQVLAQRARIPPAVTRVVFAMARPLLLAPRPRQVPADGRVLPVTGIGPEAIALYARCEHGVVPMWRLDHLRWLTDGFASTGSFVALYFACADELIGWSLLRVYASEAGCQAQIVDLFAPSSNTELFTWMVSETSCVAAGFRPDVVNALTTSPELAHALRRNGYRKGVSLPIHMWDRSRESLPAPLFFGGQWGDIPLRPFPTNWWSADEADASD